MRVLIIGNDIFAFVSAYVFRKHGFNVLLLENPKNERGIIRDFIYIRNTPETVCLMQELDVLYSTYIVRGGIMLHETVYPYPQHLRGLDKERVKRIRYDYFRKTRKIVVANPAKAMLKPIASKTKTAIRSDLVELCEKLTKSVNIIRRPLRKVSRRFIEVETGQRIFFDKLIIACPLWEIRNVTTWHIPDVVAMRSHVACVSAKGDVYQKYDFVYTPYTPANSIHFFWNDGERFYAEISGSFDHLSLDSDLNFLFKRGWYLTKMFKDLKGYTLPFEANVNWPENVYPVSPYSVWTDHLGFDDTLRESKRLAKQWTLTR